MNEDRNPGRELDRNVRITLEYDGTNFCGYQIQANERTVQGELMRAIVKILNHPIRLASAARTDTGVHAAGQVVNLKTPNLIPTDRLLKGLNALLPDDIAVQEVKDMPLDFHARFSAISRVYVYSLSLAPVRSAFKRNRFLHIKDRLDLEGMTRAAACLIGEQDFSSFRAAGDSSRHSIRRIYQTGSWQEGSDVHFYFEANAFLQHMIRNIMGTLLWVGLGKSTPEDFQQIIAKRDRQFAGPTVAPHGLCLVKVVYPEEFC